MHCSYVEIIDEMCYISLQLFVVNKRNASQKTKMKNATHTCGEFLPHQVSGGDHFY